MNKLVVTVVSVAFYLATFAQAKQKFSDINSSNKITLFKQKDTSYWIDNFRQLRDAIFKKDIAKTKSFFNFPINNEGNEIWYLAYGENEKAMEKLPGTTKPFTEQDFDKYFGKLFPGDLIKCLLKVKTDELYKKGNTVTTEIRNNSATFRLYATFDKIQNSLELNFASKTEYKNKNGEDRDSEEFNIIYYFEITKKGHIKFKQIRLAG